MIANLIENPSAVTDTSGWAGDPLARIDELEGLGFPDGVDTAFEVGVVGMYTDPAVSLGGTAFPGMRIAWSAWVATGIAESETWYINIASTHTEWVDHTEVIVDPGAWAYVSGTFTVQENETEVSVGISPQYLGAEGSRYITLVEVTADIYDWPARYPTQVIGGNGVDTLDATWEIDRKGGFVGASLDIVPPIGISRHDVSLMAPVEIRDTNGHLLWEGRVEEPGVIDRDTNTQAVECTGYVSILEDNQALICNYIDTEFAHWNTTQCTRFANRFDVQTVDDNDVPKLVMKAVQGIEIPTGANARAYWFPTNTYNGAMARYVTFRITAEGITDSFRIALYAATAPGAEKTLIWSRTTDCSALDVALDEEDIPATTACLIFRIEHTADDMTYLAYGTGDPETWGLYYGAEISRIKVYGSELSNTVTPEAVVGHLADLVTDDDHRDFPDASNLTIGQLAYFEPTTPRAVLEDVNDALDWNYGMSDGQVFFFRKPWTPATIPPGEIVVVSQKDPGLVDWNVRLDWKDVCNQVVAYYTKSNGRWGNLMVWDYEGPIEGPTPARTRFLDLRGICDTSAEATTMANRVLADSLWPKPTGTVTLKGLCTLGNGYRQPAIYLRPGMMLKCPELRLEDTGNPSGKGLMLITSVSGRLVDRQITLTLGTRSASIDRILARERLIAKTRKRKGA